MNFSGLLPHQPDHAKQLCAALTRYGSALDASDTGTGKTYVAVCLCRELHLVPLVIGPKNARATWERAAAKIGTDLEYINYEKVRGRRTLRGGLEVDALRVTQNAGVLFDTPCCVVGFRGGKPVYRKNLGWSDATDIVNAGLRSNDLPLLFLLEGPADYVFEKPFRINQTLTAESDWIVEKKYGSGSFIEWKNKYLLGIFDEVHRCGGSKSLNSKLLIAARRQFKFTLALSATAADDPSQMKALGYALGLHQLNGKYGFRPWLLKHGCVPEDGDLQGRIVLSADRTKQTEAFSRLNAEIFPAHGARMRKSEIPDFPRSKIDVKLLRPDDNTAKKLIGELHDLYKTYNTQARETGLWVHKMQALEMLMVPEILDLTDDLAGEARLAIFVSYQATREALTAQLQKKFGLTKVGWVDGSQVGARGERERQTFIDKFQANQLAAIVLNSNAGGESVSLHDPTGKIERVALITPQDSGRKLKQIFGRVDRAGGANSLQYLLYFAGTEQEKTAERVLSRVDNIELLNDADLFF